MEDANRRVPRLATARRELAAADALKVVLASLDDAKAEAPVSIDITGKSALADFMVVASGRSDRHVGAIAERLIGDLKDAGGPDLHVEGLKNCDWVLIDTGDISSTSSGPKSGPSTISRRCGWPITRRLRSQFERRRLTGGCAQAMKVAIAAIGRLKAGPERVLAERYLERAGETGRRLGITFPLREFAESRAATPALRKDQEATVLLGAVQEGAMLVALDERGKAIDSRHSPNVSPIGAIRGRRALCLPSAVPTGMGRR